jgi:hypothetical protein
MVETRDGRSGLASGTEVPVYGGCVSTDSVAWVPDSCTLPTVERPLRQAEFDTLFTESASVVDRIAATHLRVGLLGPVDLDVRVRDLADRESDCCSFFTFAVTAIKPGEVTCDITVDSARIAVLDALTARAAGNRATA